MADTTHIQRIEDAVEHLDLARVRFYALSARVFERDDADADGEISFETAVRLRDDGVDYRCLVTASHGEVTVSADAAVMYQASGSIDIESDVVLAFGDSVAMMTLFPYLRQAAGDLGMRLGYDVTLPLLQRGQVRFGKDDDYTGTNS